MHVHHMHSEPRDQKRVLDPLELELQIVVSHMWLLGIGVLSKNKSRGQASTSMPLSVGPLTSPDLCCYLLFPLQHTLNYLH